MGSSMFFWQKVYDTVLRERILSPNPSSEGIRWILLAQSEFKNYYFGSDQHDLQLIQTQPWNQTDHYIKLKFLTSTFEVWKSGQSTNPYNSNVFEDGPCEFNNDNINRFSNLPNKPSFCLRELSPKDLYIDTFSNYVEKYSSGWKLLVEELSSNFEARQLSTVLMEDLRRKVGALNMKSRLDEEYTIWFWDTHVMIEVRGRDNEMISFPVQKESHRPVSIPSKKIDLMEPSSSSAEEDDDKDMDFRPNRTHSATRRISKSTDGIATSRVRRLNKNKNS